MSVLCKLPFEQKIRVSLTDVIDTLRGISEHKDEIMSIDGMDEESYKEFQSGLRDLILFLIMNGENKLEQ